MSLKLVPSEKIFLVLSLHVQKNVVKFSWLHMNIKRFILCAASYSRTAEGLAVGSQESVIPEAVKEFQRQLDDSLRRFKPIYVLEELLSDHCGKFDEYFHRADLTDHPIACFPFPSSRKFSDVYGGIVPSCYFERETLWIDSLNEMLHKFEESPYSVDGMDMNEIYRRIEEEANAIECELNDLSGTKAEPRPLEDSEEEKDDPYSMSDSEEETVKVRSPEELERELSESVGRLKFVAELAKGNHKVSMMSEALDILRAVEDNAVYANPREKAFIMDLCRQTRDFMNRTTLTTRAKEWISNKLKRIRSLGRGNADQLKAN
jgi:hypothetical protein